MITLHEIKHRAMCLWDSGSVLCAWMGWEQLFPLVIPAGEPAPSLLAHDPDAVLDWKTSVEQHCQCHSGRGYRIEYTEIDHAQLSPYRLPARLVFDQVSDLVAFIDKGREVERFVRLFKQIRKSDVRLLRWCENHPLEVLEHEQDWAQLLMPVDYLQKTSVTGLVANDHEFPGLEHEFIRQHRLVIDQLLDCVSD